MTTCNNQAENRNNRRTEEPAEAFHDAKDAYAEAASFYSLTWAELFGHPMPSTRIPAEDEEVQ